VGKRDLPTTLIVESAFNSAREDVIRILISAYSGEIAAGYV
jgi:hypothetical protein